MNREYYIKKLESLEEIEEYAKHVEQNLLCNDLIAFLSNEMTTDEDIIRESRNDTKRGLILRGLLNKSDLAIIKAWEDAEEMPEALKRVIGQNIKKLDREKKIALLRKLIVKIERSSIIDIIDKLKNSEFLTAEDIDVLYNAVISSHRLETKDIEGILLLADGINKGTVKPQAKKEKTSHTSEQENSDEVQNEIRTKLRELFEKYGFTWEIYPDGKKWYVLTEKDEIIERINKHYENSKNRKEVIKIDLANGIKCRYEEYINYVAKYGNIESIEKMLEYLNNKGLLSKICFDGEILAKTMVLTKTEEIDSLLEVIKKHTKEGTEETALEVVSKSPTLLFKATPSLGTRRIEIGGSKKTTTTLSGNMTSFMEILSLLDEYGIKVDLSNKGLSLIGKSSQKIKRNIELLTLYDMSFGEEDAISAIGTTNPAKLIDLAIECDAYDYIRSNLSRTITTNFSQTTLSSGIIPNGALPYILKFYRERVDKENYKRLWDTPKKRLNIKDIIETCPFSSVDDIFAAYGKVKVKLNSNLEETFEKIIGTEDNTELYNYEEDDYIKAFDENFKCDDNDLAYKFGDVIISRYKFLRYYNTLINKYFRENAEEISMVYDESEIKKDILLYALTKDSMLDKNELSTIVRNIESFELGRTKRK